MNDMTQILNQLDRLLGEKKLQEAEDFMQEIKQQAKEEDNANTQLQILNEMIGFYRQTSQKEKLLQSIEEAVGLANAMGLEGSRPYATTLLNAATGYRSLGELQRAYLYYNKVEEIYKNDSLEHDMLMASLCNNYSLLYQEMKQFDKAEEYLLKALEIAKENTANFEIAVTYTNLANTCFAGKNYGKAKEYAHTAIRYFESKNYSEPHYCAALSALGMCHFEEGEYEEAEALFSRGMEILENSFGKTRQYMRLKANYEQCVKILGKIHGLELSKEYYETYGKPMLEEKFAQYLDKIAVGLAGEGSDCFGFDDALSQDHDWGPAFCLWVTDETYGKIGKELEQAYEELPSEFKGYHRTVSAQGKGRRGVCKISDFYARILGVSTYEDIHWQDIPDWALATAVNGEVYRDDEGVFSAFREKLKAGYPANIRYVKLAEAAAKFSQNGQYNYARMMGRRDSFSADLLLSESMKQAMLLYHYMNGLYPPHDKWLRKSMHQNGGVQLDRLLKGLQSCLGQKGEETKQTVATIMEEIGSFFANEMYQKNLISDVDPYLDHHTAELLWRAGHVGLSKEELVNQIVKLEFTAFDEVKNEGGRASCQDDWPTFSVMRKSQYFTWNKEMLLQYYYDFEREFAIGHNLITEKYGRMMESTAPEKYKELEPHFPVIDEQKKAIIDQIVSIQVEMMEAFAEKYPNTGGNARSLHTYEDSIVNTSYETYLRGEVSTYSDKMLQLYGRFVVECSQKQINIAKAIITNTARLYGYKSLDAFEAGEL